MGQTGRFFAVGVGPGDPALLTLRAVELIHAAHAVCHAGPADADGRALRIIAHLLQPGQATYTVLGTAMASVTAAGRQHYAAGVERIARDCRAGRQVVFITEGDPTLYSTAAHVWQRLAEQHPDIPIEICPAVSSITAGAARVQRPLAQKDEPLLILPAHYHEADLRRWLQLCPNVCLLKPARSLEAIRATVDDLGRDAVLVEEVGTTREWVTQDLHSIGHRGNYFSLVLVRPAVAELARSASEGGSVTVVGIGPGDLGLLTPQAQEALQQADVIVGFDAYLRLLEPLGLTAELLPYPIGAEAERARQALAMAQSGRRVALVSSGDAGVYGMASLLVEMAGPDAALAVIPGVTAATAAAALLGAPLGHDFCCISLSDLLTPWPVIEQRLHAAAHGDFVVALYNPLSQKRTWQLPRAREILLTARRPETPVGLVDRAHRPGMRVWQTTLGDLTTAGVGMETILIIGSSQTRVVHGRMVTPRGYEASGGRKPPEGLPAADAARPSGGLRPPLAIIDESFAIIERELGAVDLPPWAFAVARRMIHASADFEFATLLRWSADFAAAVRRALQSGAPVVTDTEMVLVGVRTALAKFPQVTLACHLNDPETTALAESAGLTRSAAGLRIAARRHASPIVVIGNAPTALDEALRLVAEEGWAPSAIIGIPVGFVGVEEAKGRLLGQTRVPYLTCVGRKGGSAVAAAAVNALVELARQ